MALNRYVGSFNTGTGTADVVITAPGFTPKAIFFWWTGRTEGADAIGVQNAQVGFGFATGTAARRSISIQSEHAQAQSDCDRVMRDDCCINTITVERAIDGLGDLKSLDANGFTIAIDDQFSRDLRVSYLALGGSDITDAALGTFTQKLTTGDQDITSVGFLPDFVMFISTGQSTVNSLSSRGPHFLSAASGSLPALNATHGHCTNNDAEDMDTCSYCLTNEAPVDMISTTGDVVGRGQVTAWLPNGFRINWVEVDGGENNYFYLAIKGGSWLVGELSTKNDGTDFREDHDGDGYTNLEEYLNGTVP